MQAVCSYFGKAFGRLKVADKGIHRRTRAITLNYLSLESNLMESEQGYVVALCLPNLPHEKHRLVSYGKCALPTKSLKGLAEWALGVSGNIRVSSFKMERRRAVNPTKVWQRSKTSHGTANEWLRPIIPEYCWNRISFQIIYWVLKPTWNILSHVWRYVCVCVYACVYFIFLCS